MTFKGKTCLFLTMIQSCSSREIVINKMLIAQRMYNTSEIQRKLKDSKRTFFQDIQLKKAKAAMARYIEEKKKNQRNSLERKRIFCKVAEQNLSFAQRRISDIQTRKLQELQQDRTHLEASPSPFAVNRKRFNDALTIMNNRANRYHLNTKE